ncbi:LOW QUALITY PROTEIN: zinc finger protein with KRAB and SCAN domains 7-like [Elgaria multicarinata webbii]|uniref:LOW QUALITY PROTEIN: zinc finger protein with KRAB and SCAN domains 7-like n=1 Tax=Elgaria multicarinata webbii TaxID=159646 RepID=UPI002FCCF89D
MKGSKVKMEDCQYGGKEPQDMSEKASQMGQANVMETAEMHEERCKSKEGPETEQEGREKECHKVTEDLTAAFSPPSKGCTRDNMPMFSKFERAELGEKAMKGRKPAGPELEGGSGRAGKTSSPVQQEYATEGPGWDASREGKGEPSRGMQERWDAQWQEFLRTLQPLHTGGESPVMSEAAPPWDDTKAFLASFEQVAKAFQWPRGEWAARLLPGLSGEAEEAFRSLEVRDQEDYGKVKAAILRGEALRMEAQRQHFRQFCCQEVRDPRRIHSQVQELCWQWLKPERHSKEQILELLILEQFLASLPVDLQGWIRAGGPDTCSQAVAMAEDFLMSQQVAETVAWEGPLKEEFEEPSDPVKGQIYKEPEQKGDATLAAEANSQAFQILHFFLKNKKWTKLKETDSRGSRLCLQIVSPSLPQSAQQTTVWQVLQEDGGNVEPLGDRKGSKVKMEECLYGGKEPQAVSGKASQMGQENVMETAEIHKERCKSKEGQETEPEGREKECHEVTEDLTAAISPPSKGRTRDNIPMFSKYGRRYCYKLQPDMIDAREDHDECPMTDENLQRNPCFDQYQRTTKGWRKSEFSENEKEANLNRLQFNQSEKKSQTSTECVQSFIYSKTLKRNQDIQSVGRPYECSHCRKCFHQREELMNHEQLHTAERGREDPESEEIFARQEKIDTRLKPYKCSQCGRCFTKKDHLRRHQRIHSGEKPYKCSHCGKCFSLGETLKRHQRIHSGEKPYKCSHCGKCFTERHYLRSHQRFHSGEKPYKCAQCGKCFTVAGSLKTHQRIHSGEKPYKCSHCGKCFSLGDTLKRHQRIHLERNHTNVLIVGGASAREAC